MNFNKNDLVESLRQAGDVVAQKVDGLYQRTRLSFSISSKESELADLYRELGQTVFGVPCAIGEPCVFSPALDGVPNLPAFATAIGLIQYGIRTYHDTGVKDIIRRIFGR